jgi:hypothetical protein
MQQRRDARRDFHTLGYEHEAYKGGLDEQTTSQVTYNGGTSVLGSFCLVAAIQFRDRRSTNPFIVVAAAAAAATAAVSAAVAVAIATATKSCVHFRFISKVSRSRRTGAGG